MATIAIYDKPMCCSTGICGPEVNSVLPWFAADLEWLRSTGHVVERFNLAHQPEAFAENVTVQKVLSDDGVDSLPLVIVHGHIVSRAAYPSRDQLAAWADGTTVGPETEETNALPIAEPSNDCCDDSGCLFVGLGIREIGLSAKSAATVRKAICKIDSRLATETAARALECRSPCEVHEQLLKLSPKSSPTRRVLQSSSQRSGK